MLFSELSRPIQSLLCGNAYRFAGCWKCERLDGTKYYFTDHDGELYFDSQLYIPSNSFSASAREKRENLETQNVQIAGYVLNTGISHADLRSGKWRDCKITENVIDWKYPFAGAFFTAVYWLTQIRFSQEIWEANIEGLSKFINRPIGKLYTRTCRAQFGDSECNIANFENYVLIGAIVTDVTSAGLDKRRIFYSDAAIEDGYFNYGKLTWTFGANSGIVSEVKTSLLANGQIELQLNLPFDIAVIDTFTIVAGCDKTNTICKSVKFNNYVNFRGCPFIPGTGEMIKGKV